MYIHMCCSIYVVVLFCFRFIDLGRVMWAEPIRSDKEKERDAFTAAAAASSSASSASSSSSSSLPSPTSPLVRMICYPEKLLQEAMKVFATRYDMHRLVYTHKAVKQIEFMVRYMNMCQPVFLILSLSFSLSLSHTYTHTHTLSLFTFQLESLLMNDFFLSIIVVVFCFLISINLPCLQISDALCLANDHILITGAASTYSPSGQYKISECIFDMTAFSQLKDSIVDIILHDQNPALLPAKVLLQRIFKRDLVRIFLFIENSVFLSIKLIR